MHRRAVEVDRPGRGQDELCDLPAGCGALEPVVVAAPELSVGRAVDIAVPGVEVGDASGGVVVLEGQLDVGDVMARGCKRALEPVAMVAAIESLPTIVAASGP